MSSLDDFGGDAVAQQAWLEARRGRKRRPRRSKQPKPELPDPGGLLEGRGERLDAYEPGLEEAAQEFEALAARFGAIIGLTPEESLTKRTPRDLLNAVEWKLGMAALRARGWPAAAAAKALREEDHIGLKPVNLHPSRADRRGERKKTAVRARKKKEGGLS